MPPEPAIAPLQIAVTTGTISPFLTALLSKQRIEEPQTPVHIIETSTEEQYQGIKERWTLLPRIILGSGGASSFRTIITPLAR
jgi:siroheme synthase (precorrin-2 oxidase/ferrochelatase)